jgi:hypothetical protein
MDERFEHLPQVAPAICLGAQPWVGRKDLRERGLASASYVLMVVDAEGQIHNRILIKE